MKEYMIKSDGDGAAPHKANQLDKAMSKISFKQFFTAGKEFLQSNLKKNL